MLFPIPPYRRAICRKPRPGALTRILRPETVMALGLAVCLAAGAQQSSSDPVQPQIAVPSPGSDAGNAAASQEPGADERNDMEAPGSFDAPLVLSADQIVHMLQQSPAMVVEVKSMMADRMQDKGEPVEIDSISDEALYSQIAANAALRAAITSFLRARGYIAVSDLDSLASEDASQATSPVPSSQPLSQISSMDEAGLTPGANPEVPRYGPGAASPEAAPAAGPRPQRGAARDEGRNEETHASTDPPTVLREPAPYNLQSMRDLYTQVSDHATSLKRFGSEVFVERNESAATRGASGPDSPLDVPVGPDYVIGPGDTLTIHLWGGVTQSMTRIIDRDGHIFLPEAGSLQMAGLPLGRAQNLIEAALDQQYRNAQVAVTIARLRSVRVYVVGDVQRPGGYDISSLATPVSALFAAGGPTSVGSLRIVRHYRGNRLIEDIDLYDFLLHGIRSESARFQSGDTLLVPPAGPQVAVFGAVKRPAIYEMKAGESTLQSIVDDAGGFTAAASPGHITIERIDAHLRRETLTLNVAVDGSPDADRNAMASFAVKDGDRIRIEPVLPYSQRAVYLEGHVVRPGRLPFSDGMQLSDVLHSYRDMLPEPAAHGEIVRLSPPDLHAETIEFDVPDLLIGNFNINLQPFDTIRVFGRYEADAPKVTIRGEVLRPGVYPMSKGMTASQLVRMAGGFKRDALRESADLTSYSDGDANGVMSRLETVAIGSAVAGTDPRADVDLKPGDILSIHQITGWSDIGQSIKIQGQVRFPGSYGFHEGETLSSALKRAGGLLPTAYPTGAVLIREQVKDLELKSREELIRQIETSSAAARLSPSVAGANSASVLQMIQAQEDQVIQDLKSHPPSGRMVIHLTADIDQWANTPADIQLRRGDELLIPKEPGFVLITGQVYNATALTYTPGKTAGWYLSRAGGANSTANRKEIFIIRANGSVYGRRSGGWLVGDVLAARLNPGDVVVVPQKMIGGSVFWRNVLTAGQIAASAAITAGVAVAAL